MHTFLLTCTDIIAAILVISGASTQSINDDSQSATPPGAYREAAQPGIDHRPYRVGELVSDFSFTTIDGTSSTLCEFAGDQPLVIAIRDVGCPLSKKYGPRLAALEEEYSQRGVQFLYINPSEIDDIETMHDDARSYELSSLYVADREATIARQLHATRTTDVFLLDAAQTLVYRGAIDDQYGIGYALETPRHEFLRDAIEAVLADDTVKVRATEAPGCLLSVDYDNDMNDKNHATEDEPIEVTYHNRISRIIQQNCQSCHRADGAAPFALETYNQVKGRRRMIEFAIDMQLMPPWHADAATSHEFANDRSLSQRDRDAVIEWIANKCPEGNLDDAPLPLEWTTAWQIGEPDAVVKVHKPNRVPAEGTVQYKYMYVKTNFDEDKWISQMEIRPTHPEVVHHVLVFLEEPMQEGETRRDVRRRWQGGLRGYFAGLVPGQSTTHYPEGLAKKLPAGAWLKFQIHYTPNGTEVMDQPELGFVFADEPPKHELRTASAMNQRFTIPPGDHKYQVDAETRFSRDSVLYSFAPHMHVRGKAFRYELVFPDGREEVVLDIPRYDFNWQTRYRLREPIHLPAGTVLKATAWYDNSENNPANPDPTKRVRFGEQTWEEMMIGYFEYWRVEE